MSIDRQFLVWALAFAAVGMGLGIHMAASQNHGQFPTHAHILLVGFVVSLVYGVIHRLWLDMPTTRVARIQFVLHQLGAVVLSAGLFLMYGGFLPRETVDPVLAVASISVLAAMLMMLWMVIRDSRPVTSGASS